MKISQNKNNIYVKNLDNIETNMLSSIKRYVETGNTNKSDTIDNIVSEVVSRVKEQLLKDGTLK